MNLSELKNTNDEQFKNDVTFTAMMPTDDGETATDIKLTVKSARNPAVKGRLTKLLGESEKERKKLENPNLNDKQVAEITKKIDDKDAEVAKLILVSVSGITDKGKPVEPTPEFMASLVENYGWIRDNIVQKASSQQAFFTS